MLTLNLSVPAVAEMQFGLLATGLHLRQLWYCAIPGLPFFNLPSWLTTSKSTRKAGGEGGFDDCSDSLNDNGKTKLIKWVWSYGASLHNHII